MGKSNTQTSNYEARSLQNQSEVEGSQPFLAPRARPDTPSSAGSAAGAEADSGAVTGGAVASDATTDTGASAGAGAGAGAVGGAAAAAGGLEDSAPLRFGDGEELEAAVCGREEAGPFSSRPKRASSSSAERRNAAAVWAESLLI
jgi:hypothetical protein